ncbi:MAG TPA: PDZ domain-containing protein, partial [Firmicutes bacterium]|nr:PDZ domain-containing protein [Bacillota bacterium]
MKIFRRQIIIMHRFIQTLLLAALVFTPVNSLVAQESGDQAFTFNREEFPPVIVGQLASDCLVTIQSVRLAFAGFSMLDPYNRTISEVGGSGFIVHPDGYILTTPDMAGTAKSLTIEYKGVEYEASVEVVDGYYNLALLKIDKTGLPAIKWGDSNTAERGMPVVVLGAPAGLERTLTYGFLTNIRDFRVTGPRGFDGMLIKDGFVIDAALHGDALTNPVFNSKAELVGIVGHRDPGAQNIGYVMPSNLVKSIVDQMIKDGKVCHPWLGIFAYPYYTRTLALYMGIPIDEIDPETGQKYDVVGVLVDFIAQGSPAAAAGIVRGDLILRADGELIRTIGDLETKILNKGCGEEMSLVIIRNYQLRYINIQIGDKQEDYGNIYAI